MRRDRQGEVDAAAHQHHGVKRALGGDRWALRLRARRRRRRQPNLRLPPRLRRRCSTSQAERQARAEPDAGRGAVCGRASARVEHAGGRAAQGDTGSCAWTTGARGRRHTSVRPRVRRWACEAALSGCGTRHPGERCLLSWGRYRGRWRRLRRSKRRRRRPRSPEAGGPASEQHHLAAAAPPSSRSAASAGDARRLKSTGGAARQQQHALMLCCCIGAAARHADGARREVQAAAAVQSPRPAARAAARAQACILRARRARACRDLHFRCTLRRRVSPRSETASSTTPHAGRPPTPQPSMSIELDAGASIAVLLGRACWPRQTCRRAASAATRLPRSRKRATGGVASHSMQHRAGEDTLRPSGGCMRAACSPGTRRLDSDASGVQPHPSAMGAAWR